MFSQMPAAARARLTGRDCSKIAERAGIPYNRRQQIFSLTSLGQTIEISPSSWMPALPLAEWHHLVLLHYLDLADGTPPANRSISFSQMKDGLIRGSGLDRKCEAVIQTLMRRISPQELSARCIGMGGTAIQGNADFSVVFSVLPNVPFSLNIWFADEDFDASGRLMLDANADHYLTIEDAVTIGELILERLEGR